MNSFAALLLVATSLFSQAPGHDWSVRVTANSHGAECRAHVVTLHPAITSWPSDEQAIVIGHEMTHCLQGTSYAFGAYSSPCWAEIEADDGGIMLASAAGYDGRAALARVLTRMGAESGCALKRLNHAKGIEP